MTRRLFLTAVCLLAMSAQAQSPARAGNRVIAGVVESAANDEPLAGAEVTLQDPGFHPVAETHTGVDGRFSFPSLADGKYVLTASHRGYATSAYEEHGGPSTWIVTGEGQDTTGLTLSLTPLGSIVGSVVEDSGDPVPNARVQLYWRARIDGMEGVRRGQMAMADKMGNFQIADVRPGEYYLCATGTPWYRFDPNPALRSPGAPASLLDVAYALTCDPDASDPAGAELITMAAGEHIEANVTMHPQPSVHIFIDVPRAGPGSGFSMPQLSQEAFGISDDVFASPMVQPQAGPGGQETMRVELSGIPAGQYSLELQSGNPPEGAQIASVDASSGDVHIDVASLPELASVSGKLAIAGGGHSPADCTVSLSSERGFVSSSKVAADGTFHIPSLQAGSYEAEVNCGSAYLSLPVTHLSATGATIADSLLKVGNAPIQLSVVAVNAQATVTGFVTRNGKPAGGVFALLVPQQLNGSRYTWKPNQSDSDGSLTFDNVAPGTYAVVAIDRGWTLDWRKPEVISAFLAAGVRVAVSPNATRVELTAPVETQRIVINHP